MSKLNNLISFNKRFRFAEAVSVPFPRKIKEGYEKTQNGFQCNISYEKLEPFLLDFISMLTKPLFLVISIPLNVFEEKKLRKNEADSFHDEVLYLDGCSKADIFKIWNDYGEILLKDGMSQFGVASHVTGDEMFIKKYKIIDIYSKEAEKYINLLRQYGVDKTEPLLTVWKTFSKQNPGMCKRVTINNRDVYEVVEELKKIGMYRAKLVEK